MDRKQLLEVANYPLCYPGLWKLCAGFTDRMDADFPLDEEAEVDVLSFFGNPLEDCRTAIITSDGKNDLESEAYAFALTLALNGVCASMATSYGDNARALRSGYIDGGGRMELYLDLPLTAITERPALRGLASQTLINGGVVYSPWRPGIEEGDAWKRSLFCTHLATRRRNIVVLGCRKRDMEAIESALDCGSEVFVHSSFLSSPCARMLAEDGARLIDSAAGYLEAVCQDCHCRLYPDERGAYGRKGRRWYAFRY